MIGVKDQNDRRDSWHHGGWGVKMIAWFLLVVLMFFVPNVIVSIYGKVSFLFAPHNLTRVAPSICVIVYAVKSFRNSIKIWCWSVSVGSSGLVARCYT